MSCTNSVASEDFADFIAPYFTTPEEFIRSQGTDCIDFVNSTLAVVYVPLSTVTPSTPIHIRQFQSYIVFWMSQVWMLPGSRQRGSFRC